MTLRSGTRARFTLTDGTTFEGTVRRTWLLWFWKIDRATVDSPTGPIEAAGAVYIGRHHVLWAQALPTGGEE